MRYVLYYGPGLDALISAAIVLRALSVRGKRVVVGGALSYGRDGVSLAKLEGSERSIIFIFDFSPAKVDEKVVPAISRRNRFAYWSCSQAVSAQVIADLGEHVKVLDLVSRPGQRVCAQLVRERFLPGDSIAGTLEALARDVKCSLGRDARAAKLVDLLSSGIDTDELVRSLSKGVLWMDRWEERLREYRVKKEHALSTLMDGLVIWRFGQVRVGMAFASSVLSSADACSSMLDAHDGFDVALAVFRDGRLALRSREGVSLDLSALARQFGGGGKPFAAGAVLPDKFCPVTLSLQEDVSRFVRAKLHGFFYARQ